MSHIRDSPEFRVQRTDSRDPATTCRGVTSDGRKCRRTVISKSSTTIKDGLLKAKQPAELFCWQHQSQALTAAAAVSAPGKPASRLKARSSLDTLIERTGLLSVNDDAGRREDARRQPAAAVQGARKHQRFDDILEPRAHSSSPGYRPPAAPVHRGGSRPVSGSSGHKRKSSSGKKFVCFITDVSDDELQIRRRPGHVRASSENTPRVMRTPPGVRASNYGRMPAQAVASPGHHAHRPSPLERPRPVPLTRPSQSLTPRPASSRTQYLLSWIPPNLSPETTSKLLQKLAEPLSAAEEAGYIYIYCVTPPNSAPSPEAASLLIPPPTTTANGRRTSDVLLSAGIPTNKVRDAKRDSITKTITLKIGRAVNVSRRLTQQLECAHNLTLVRYYPHTSSAPAMHAIPRKAPNLHRLERLVHIELADRRVKLEDPCAQCGKRHQEYFEIEAEREQLRLVDECVRRWVRYSEQNPNI